MIRLAHASAIAGLAAALWAQGGATFRSTTDAVTVDVSVRAGSRVVTGLKAGDFVILDNGVAQKVTDISYGKLPIDVTVAFDISYSVTGDLLQRLRRAVVQLMRDLGKEDRLKLLLFSHRINRTVDFTTDVASVESAMRTITPGGGTTLYDAMSVALVSASPRDRRQLIVFFTDGGDNSSMTDDGTLVDVARRTRATMTLVMPQQINFGSTSPRARLLSAMAAETGGSVLPAGMDLSLAFQRALDEFRSTYVLHFTPQGVERGGFHTLGVSVNRKDATVLARRSYVGG